MTDSFKPLSAQRQAHAEGVIWDDLVGVVRWTDIASSHLYAYDPATGVVDERKMPARLCCFALTHEPGVLLLALEKQLARYDTRDGTMVVLGDIEADLPGTRANDGRCDRGGNFIFGTLNERGPEQVASFWRYTFDGQLSRLALPKAAITNSICFSPDGETMYFTDSPTARIMACDYDAATGEVDRIRGFADLTPVSSRTVPPWTPTASCGMRNGAARAWCAMRPTAASTPPSRCPLGSPAASASPAPPWTAWS